MATEVKTTFDDANDGGYYPLPYLLIEIGGGFGVPGGYSIRLGLPAGHGISDYSLEIGKHPGRMVSIDFGDEKGGSNG